MKYPSIHVRHDDLVSALAAQGISVDLPKLLSDLKGKALVRVIVSMDKNTASKVALRQEDAWVSKVITICNNERRLAGHKGVVTPTKGSTTFQQFKIVSARIKALADDYEDEPENMAEFYFKTAIKELGSKYNFNRLLSETTHDNISAVVRQVVDVINDPNKELTKSIFNAFITATNVNEHIAAKMKDKPATYQHFVAAAKMAAELKASGEDWVAAQVKGLAFTGKPIIVEQLCTESAETRFLSYRAEGNEESQPSKQPSEYEKILQSKLKR